MFTNRTRGVAILLFATFTSNLASGQNADIFVDPTSPAGTPNGTNWANAFHTVQEAIDLANGVSNTYHVAVAQGTYKPDSSETWGGTGQRNEVIRLKTSSSSDPIFLHGGFLGYNGGGPNTGTIEWDSPDGRYGDTILSGNADGALLSNYHVVVADTEATILAGKVYVDGFKITGGEADGSGVNDDGAGVYCTDDAEVRLENITFVDNQAAEDGGGVYNTTTGTTNLLEIKVCTFEDNMAKRGAGLFVFACPDLKIANADFHGNGSESAGPGGFPPITTNGGAIFTADETVLDCANALIDNNFARKGGAVYIDPVLCGSGSYLQYWRNCTFADNANPSAYSADGAGFHLEARTAITGCADTELWLYNCVFWGQASGRDVYLEDYNKVNVNYTDWDAVSTTSGTGAVYTVDAFSITSDPEFVDAANHNYRLDVDADSPCIAAGDASEVGVDFLDLDRDDNVIEDLPRDLDFALRLTNGDVDMGAYESNDG